MDSSQNHLPHRWPGSWAGSFIWGAQQTRERDGHGATDKRASDKDAGEKDVTVGFRRSFEIADRVSTAPIRIFADGRYVLFVNGVEVRRGPVRGQPRRRFYDTFDLAPFFHAGTNVIAAIVRHYGQPLPMWAPATAIVGMGRGGFVAELRIGSAPEPNSDPGKRDHSLGALIVTDDSWEAVRMTAWTPQSERPFLGQLAEVFDARMMPIDWSTTDNALDWQSATVLRPVHVGAKRRAQPPIEPFGMLRESLLPNPVGTLHLAKEIWSIGLESLVVNSDPVGFVDTALAAAREHMRTDGSGPESLSLAGSVCHSVAAYDLGHVSAGVLTFEVETKAGTQFDISLSEEVDADGIPSRGMQHHGFRYTAREGSNEFRSIDLVGTRFITLVASFPLGQPTPRILAIGVDERHHPVGIDRGSRSGLPVGDEPTDGARSTAELGPVGVDRGSRSGLPVGDEPTDGARSAAELGPVGVDTIPYFRCSDERLNRIWQIGRRTVSLCSLDAYVDCPTREQRAWTGDEVVHQMVDLLSSSDWSMARHHPVLTASPRADGMLPMAVAGDLEAMDMTSIPDWSLHWVRSVHNLMRWIGDRKLVAELLPVAELVVRWFAPYQGDDGLLHDLSGWTLIDWSTVPTEGTSAVETALWARALRDVREIANWLEQKTTASWCADRYACIVNGFDQFWCVERNAYQDRIAPAQQTISQHTNAAALVAGLVPRNRYDSVVALLVDRSNHVYHSHGMGDGATAASLFTPYPDRVAWDASRVLATQPFFRYVVHDALAAADRADLIADACLDWWKWVERGETTWPEIWNGGTHCHGWSSTPTRDLLQYVLGVEPAEPGYRSARIRPRLGSLEWAEGAVPTLHGLIHVQVARGEVIVTSPIPYVVELT